MLLYRRDRSKGAYKSDKIHLKTRRTRKFTGAGFQSRWCSNHYESLLELSLRVRSNARGRDDDAYGCSFRSEIVYDSDTIRWSRVSMFGVRKMNTRLDIVGRWFRHLDCFSQRHIRRERR